MLKPTPKFVLNLHLKGFSSSYFMQQHEATIIMGSANESRNETTTNFKLKLDDNISPPPPIVARSKSNVVVVASYGAIDSLG
jgi:HKD family nuclease